METSRWHIYCTIVIQSVALSIQLLIIIMYIRSTMILYQKNKLLDISLKMEILNIATLLTLFTSTAWWLSNYCGLFEYLSIDCNYVFSMAYLLYLYHHGLLYSIYVLRLHIVYDNTKFQLSKQTKIALWLIIALYFSSYTVIVFYENFIENISHFVIFSNGMKICWGELSSILIVTGFIMIQSLFPLITMILFIKPLYILYSKSSVTVSNTNADEKEQNVSLLKLLAKYSLLTVITIISSSIACIMHVIVEIMFVAGISVAINAICIILYEKRFIKYYLCLCSKLDHKIDEHMKRTSDISYFVRTFTDSMKITPNMERTDPSNIDIASIKQKQIELKKDLSLLSIDLQSDPTKKV